MIYEKILLSLILYFSIFCEAIAVTTNCVKSITETEKLICDNKELSILDIRLNNLYKPLTKSMSKNDDLKSKQKKWLADVRNRCENENCLKSVYIERLEQLEAIKLSRWKSFHDDNLGVAFSYPQNRKIVIGCRRSKNCIAMTSKKSPKSQYVAALEVFDEAFDKTAVDHAVFFKTEKNIWGAKGRFGEYKVDKLQGSNWQGIKATVDCGISDSLGFHAGAGECLWAVISNGERTIAIDTMGRVGNDEDTLLLIKSIRFLK